MINDIFQDLIIKGTIIVYLDNILIFIWIVYKILEVLAKYKLFLHFKKCEFDK